MSHFVGAVVVPASVSINISTNPSKYPDFYGADAKEAKAGPALADYLQQALAKFDENIRVPRYVEYTKEALIAKERAEVRAYAEGTYADYLRLGEAGYVEKFKGANQSHLHYLREEFPKRLEWTDEEHYANGLRWSDEENIGPDGEVYSTYNPHSKWDWYVVGGRWEQVYRERQGEPIAALLASLKATKAAKANPSQVAELKRAEAEVERVRNRVASGDAEYSQIHDALDKLYACEAYGTGHAPYSIVVPKEADWEWIERGQMGWWGMSSGDQDDDAWLDSVITVLEAQAEGSRLVYVDFHI